MREVVDFGLGRLLVQVFEQDQRPMLLGMADDALQPLAPGGHPHLAVRGEMIAGMDHDPFGAEPGRHLDIGFEIIVDGLADIGRIFGDIDRGGGVQAEMDAVPLTRPTNRGRARVVKGCQRIGAGVELDVDPPHLVRGRPFDRIFEPQALPDIDPDPIPQPHALFSRRQMTDQAKLPPIIVENE